IMGPSLAMIHRLRALASSVGDEGAGLALETLRAIEGNVTTQMDLALWQVAVTIQGDAEALAIFTGESADSVARLYQAGDLPTAAQRALEEFLAQYGMRGVGEIDLGRSRWRDNPAEIVGTVQSYLAIADPSRAPEAVFRAGAAAAEQATEKLASLVGVGWGGKLRERQVRFLVAHLRGMSGARETPKFAIVQVMGIARDGLLASGGDLVEAGVLERADDVYFLRVRELDRIFAALDEGWKPLVEERRERYRREQQRRQVPRIMVGDGRTIHEGLGNAADRSISGSPVSPGVAQGRVRVVFQPQAAELVPGEILVCPGTDPAWTPLFLAAAGLITEVGGMMTHGSVVAREYGIPAIVGVHEATTRLRTGQLIRMDGTAGTIEILE
ncbi:MAG: PEP-utilizing enzyme, partial [Micropruina sp.]